MIPMRSQALEPCGRTCATRISIPTLREEGLGREPRVIRDFEPRYEHQGFMVGTPRNKSLFISIYSRGGWIRKATPGCSTYY
jgi:hypothetical protein